MFETYDHQVIESKWRKTWAESGQYRTPEADSRPKFYCLDFFPYPSGEGLHIGHCRNYVPTDVISRFYRMRGYDVLHPMGWDSFGEPAEQFAVRHGVHPRITTDRNSANYRRQMDLIATSYDWDREIDSSRPEYYRWTQWFFLKMYERDLAYYDISMQWWCPVCQTTLSSHEAAGGVCWRGHTGLRRVEIPAWYFRITAYADELLSGLDQIDWPERVKAMQRNWIGRSEGCRIDFQGPNGEVLPVFTTRPDTLFGATFFVLAPEHPALENLTMDSHRERVRAYVEKSSGFSEIERMDESRPKTGEYTGGSVRNPLSGEQLPVWVADYVLPGYGTGAVMGVPAHDERDFEFAHRYDLPVRVVVVDQSAAGEQPDTVYTGPGILINSDVYDGMTSDRAAQAIAADLGSAGSGGLEVQYRMRDWLISRQRYWGTPIPIVHCQTCGLVPVPEDELPVLLPDMQDFMPDGSGRSPLGRIPEFVNTVCPQCGGEAQRETDTMGGFACSSWYFLRFTSPHYHAGPFDPQEMRRWMPVDLYVGGTEHAVLHLLYARFWTRALSDMGLLPFKEPFSKLMSQGQLLGNDGARMSKSRGNVITPDEIVAECGADALRIYAMFIAPFEQDAAWNPEGIAGVRRFLNRVWALYTQTDFSDGFDPTDDQDLVRLTHTTIRRITERIGGFRFNTMVSALMEFVNALAERYRQASWRTVAFQDALDVFMRLLAPAAPYLAEELWARKGGAGSIHDQAWPDWDPQLAVEQVAEIPVQVDGKVRDLIRMPVDEDREYALAAALKSPKVRHYLNGLEPERVFFVPGRVLNLLVKRG